MSVSSTVPILDARGVTKSFGGVSVLNGVDFDLAEGELRCLIGPNGAGKSTFFKLITGQLRTSGGRLLFRGVELDGASPLDIARRQIGLKPQVPSLFDGLSVHEHLRLAARRTNSPRRAQERIHALLEQTRLSAKAHAMVGTLAHGQRQWVELAMVLAGEPQLVLLDEPTAGLTRDEVAATAELIRSVRGGRAWLIVEHDMSFVRELADRVTVFHQGRSLLNGTANVVLQDDRVREIYLGSPLVRRSQGPLND